MLKFHRLLLATITFCLPIPTFAFQYATDLSLPPDTNHYSQWCYIDFPDSHLGLSNRQPPCAWSTTIISLPKGAKGMQLTWYSPDANSQNPGGKRERAYIMPLPAPSLNNNKNAVLLRTIQYWSNSWKLYVGFDTGNAGTTPTTIEPCDARQFTPRFNGMCEDQSPE